VSGARQALGFLTILGRSAAPGPEALAWFPLAGAAIGLAVGGVWWGAAQVWTRPVAAAIAVAADLALTGMLHLDGLCDAADGLLPPLPRERRLAVMRSPDVGAFGVGAAVTVVVLRWAALGAHTPVPLLVAALWGASRALMAVVVARVPYARHDGLATAFIGGNGVLPAIGFALCLALAAVWRPAVGPLAVLSVAVGGAAVVGLAWRRVGGFTGDVLGAAGMVGETVGLLVAVARW
jgi:adenosylcobinamide-GDP ribazoletransferase